MIETIFLLFSLKENDQNFAKSPTLVLSSIDTNFDSLFTARKYKSRNCPETFKSHQIQLNFALKIDLNMRKIDKNALFAPFFDFETIFFKFFPHAF